MNNLKELEELYNKNVHKLYKFFYYKTLNKTIAEDLTSDTFLQFANSYNVQIQNNEAFLYGIAKNIFIEYLKRKYKEEIPLDYSTLDFIKYTEDYIENVKSTPNLEDYLLKLLPRLPQKQAMIIKLRLIDKLTIKEICSRLNKEVSYVKTTQNRAIKTLKRILELET